MGPNEPVMIDLSELSALFLCLMTNGLANPERTPPALNQDSTHSSQDDDDDDVIYFQYDPSTPLRFSPLHNASTKSCAPRIKNRPARTARLRAE